MSFEMISVTPSKDDSFEDFEFCESEFESEADINSNSEKSPVKDAVEKLGSGVGLIFSALCTLTEEQGLVMSVPVRAVATTAATAITGSLIGGLPGLAVGLVSGAVLAYRTSPNRKGNANASASVKKYTLRDVITQMTMQQKKDLIRELLGCLKHPSIKLLISEMLRNEEIRNITLTILSNFLMRRMGISLLKTK